MGGGVVVVVGGGGVKQQRGHCFCFYKGVETKRGLWLIRGCIFGLYLVVVVVVVVAVVVVVVVVFLKKVGLRSLRSWKIYL